MYSPGRFYAVFTILFAGLTAGLLDGTAAIVSFMIDSPGKNPALVFKYIASALLGNQAFTGGTSIVILGMLLHLLIACIFAALFYLLYQWSEFIKTHPVISGLLYGLIIWCVMNLLVLPLSLIPPRPAFEAIQVLKGVLILVLFAGLPIALVVRKRQRRAL